MKSVHCARCERRSDMSRTWSVHVLALLVVLMTSFTTSSVWADNDWKKLGERTVNGKLDKDVIEVGLDDGLFTAIQVKVEGSALQMYDVKVVFLNGQTFSP